MNYFKQTLGVNFSQKHILAILIAIPLIMGAMYGFMYNSMMSSGQEALAKASGAAGGAATATATTTAAPDLPPLLIVEGLPKLSAIATMQLSVFCSATFFMASFGAARFVKSRSCHIHKRLIALGLTDSQVYWGEAASYFMASLVITLSFNALFVAINLGQLGETVLGSPSFYLNLTLLGFLQSAVGTAYALLALGLFKEEKTFSLYHFLPAFLMTFIGGGMFPISSVSSSGFYELMPNYVLSTQYTALYTGTMALDGPTLVALGALLIFSLAFTAIGRMRFTLKEVA